MAMTVHDILMNADAFRRAYPSWPHPEPERSAEMLDTTVDETALFDQVRRLKEHDDLRGGYLPVVIGHWDRLGYTRCLDCPPQPAEPPARIDAIYCDNSAAEGERCDLCGASLLAAALKRHGKEG